MSSDQVPWRELRTSARLSLRDLEARTGINRGRLSIIERGVQPTPDEERSIRTTLVAAHLDLVPKDAA
jgi:transcriptional regulator with XRE-family HTH domain